MAFADDDPEIKAWIEAVEHDMLPKMESSELSVAIFNGTIDAKLCVEIGAAILYDKPVVVIAPPGARVPKNLEQCALIVRGDPKDPATQQRMTEAISLALGRPL